ncbi:MAG: hypothetical protein LBP68_04110 [Acidobacteriota bacterium]|nr:hypothetical protein [Acidobacteriota bacterium]
MSKRDSRRLHRQRSRRLRNGHSGNLGRWNGRGRWKDRLLRREQTVRVGE